MSCNLGLVRKGLSSSVLALALLPWACQKKAMPPVSPPPPLPPTASAPAPVPMPAPIPGTIPTPPVAPTSFDLGETYFEMGDYAKAAQAYETYLRNNPSAANQDRALFRLALSHAYPESAVRNLPQTMNLLQQLVKRFPQSPLRLQSELLLGLQGEIDKLHGDVSKRDDRIQDLTKELERLKQIDMQRRPARP